MTVYLNGEIRELPAGRSVPELMTDLGLPLQAALVELNGVALLRSEWAATGLKQGDRLEILRVVAGG